MTVLRWWRAELAIVLAVGCAHAPPPARDSAEVRIGGDTALAPSPVATHAPAEPDTGIWLKVEFDGHGTELSITTGDHRTFVDSTPLGPPAPAAPERPDTNSSEGECDCGEDDLTAPVVPPGVAWLQVRGIDDGEVGMILWASSSRSVNAGSWRSPLIVLKKGEIRRWRLQVPTSAHPESLTVTPAEEP